MNRFCIGGCDNPAVYLFAILGAVVAYVSRRFFVSKTSWKYTPVQVRYRCSIYSLDTGGKNEDKWILSAFSKRFLWLYLFDVQRTRTNMWGRSFVHFYHGFYIRSRWDSHIYNISNTFYLFLLLVVQCTQRWWNEYENDGEYNDCDQDYDGDSCGR